KLLKALSYASAMFTLLIAVTMIFSFLQLTFVKPLENPVLTELKKEYDANPNLKDLKEQIRTIDLMARKAYFSTRWQIETGSYLLLFGALAFFLSQHFLRADEKIIPDFLADSPSSSSKKDARKYLISAAIIVMASAVAISVYMRNSLPNPTAVPEELIEAGVSSTANPPVQEQLSPTNEITSESQLAETTDSVKKTDNQIKSLVREPVIQSSNPASPALKDNDIFPFFRGIGSRGKVSSGNYPTKWNGKTGSNILWKIEIPLPGFNSPIVWGEKIFLTGSDKNNAKVFCINKNSGKIMWTSSASNIPGEPAKAPETSDDTGLAAPTAATNGEIVAAIFGTGNLVCLDMDGKTLWAKNIGIPENHYGHSSSLIIHNDKIFVQYDHFKSKSLMAFDKKGNKLWETKRNVALSWASPVLAVFDGVTQIILSSDPAVISYDVNSGKELWSVNCMSAEVGPSVGVNSKYVFAANEFAKLVAIKPGANASIVWSDNEYLPEVSSPLATEEYLFIATSYGAIACYDTNNGQKLWEHEFDHGFYSSPILVGNKVYLIDQKGIAHIFKADKVFTLIDESPLGEPVVSTPACAGGKIYIRGEKHLYCISE
ncbi:MAG: PQQ-binding-like beta-propeller repeat protein, partial [Bacteroidota bacterium]